MFPEIEVTDTDREKYWGYTESAIYGIKLIAAMSTRFLMTVLDDKLIQEKLSNQIGKNVYRQWIINKIAEELFRRGAIGVNELDSLTWEAR